MNKEKLRDPRTFTAAEIAKFTPEQHRGYIECLNSYRDFKNSMDTARAEGKEKGMEKGRAEGMEKGRAEGK